MKRKVDSEVSVRKGVWDVGHEVPWVGHCGGSAVVADMGHCVEMTDVFDPWSSDAGVRISRGHSSAAGSVYAFDKTIYCSSVKSAFPSRVCSPVHGKDPPKLQVEK